MQIEGPFSWDQLVLEAGHDDEYDLFDENELYAAWSKMKSSEKACHDFIVQTVAMTPLSRSSSSGPLPRLEEVWDSALDTPLATANKGPNEPSILESPLVRKVKTARPVPPSRLHECIIDGFASSPGSRQDLFTKQEPENCNDFSSQGCFGGFTGIIADSLLEGLNTPSQLRNDLFEEDEPNDILLDDMLDGIEAGDLDFGLTQGVLGKEISITSPDANENLGISYLLSKTDDLRPAYLTTSDFDLPRPSALFTNVELNVSTPVTPCRDGGVAPDTLVTGTSSCIDTPDVSKENLNASENVPKFVGFASASGKKLSAPSLASMEKAKVIFRDLEEETNTEPNGHQPEDYEAEKPAPLLSKAPPVPFSLGFSSASGKRSVAPSELALKKAKAMFDTIERQFQAEEYTEDRQALPPQKCESKKASQVPFSVGFSSASGKNTVAPSEVALKKARVMFDSIEREFQAEPQSTTKPALKRQKSSGALDLKKISRNQTGVNQPLKAAPKFSNLKTAATKTLGNPRRSSTSVGRGSVRSSISPSSNKRISVNREEAGKPDPLKYFDLTIPENRVQLNDLGLNGPALFEDIFCDRGRIFTSFMSKGPNPNCVDKKWALNHIDLIWWKVTSTLAHFRDRNFYGGTSIEKIVVDQLLYRYEREVNMTQMSVLKKISEGNDSPVGLFIFLIKDFSHERNELLLSDGWYSLWAVVDKATLRLLEKKSLRIGMKMEVTNIGLLKKDETAILDAEESGFKMSIAYNSIRPCRWHQKLGRKKSFTFRRPLKYVHREGGAISCVESVVTKRYPDIIVVHWEDDKPTEKSKHEWEKMVNSNFDNGQNRPDSISKTVRLQVVDQFCGTNASVKLLKVSEEMAEKLVEGRIIRLLECKPLHDLASSLELRVYKTLQQCFLLGMNSDTVQMKPDTTKLFDLVGGCEYDVALRIVRFIPGENHLWGINSDGVLISIDLGRFAPTLPKFTTKELVLFLNLEYKAEDKRLGIEVFSLSIVSDWDRRSCQALKIDLDESLFEKASQFIDGIVSGRFSYS